MDPRRSSKTRIDQEVAVAGQRSLSGRGAVRTIPAVRRLPNPALATASQRDEIIRLQRLAGNRATVGLLQRQRPDVIQRYDPPTTEELVETGDQMDKFSAMAPQANAHLWRLQDAAGESTLMLLGTVHVTIDHFPTFTKAGELMTVLENTKFDLVFQELIHQNVDPQKYVSTLRQLITLKGALPANPNRIQEMRYKQAKSDLDGKLGTGSDKPLVDDFLSYLAAHGSNGVVQSLEGGSIRGDIRALYANQPGGLNTAEYQPVGDESDLVYTGNQSAIAKLRADELKKGNDAQDHEARNQYWVKESQQLQGSPYKGKCVLWVVGASHIGGLVSNLERSGWTSEVVAL